MDSFFASVEVREDERLKNLPVIIGADPKGGVGRGVVSTCSYEARRYGIHSAMPVQTAYRLCPDAVFLPVNMPLYRQVSKNIMNIIKKYSEKIEQVSIDEAYLDLGHIEDFSAAEEISQEIRNAIFEKENITCSVGISPSKVVSKVASDFKKPNGLTVVRPEEVSSFLNPMPIGKIPGAGKKTQDILKKAGIITIKDLLEYDIQSLISLIGRHAADLKIYASGIDKREVLQRDSQKSIGRERTYQKDTRDREAIIATVGKICDEIREKVASKKIHFRTVTIKIRYSGFITHTKSVTLRRYSADTENLFSLAIKLMNNYLDSKTPVRLVGVSVSNFESPKTIQKKLFDFSDQN
jgi:DNA polymerase IV (DinB-like DNA polymerase)